MPDSFPDLGDRYEVIATLGHGVFGTVYEAHDRKLKRRVAVKCVDGNALEEARAMARIEHSNVVRIHDVDQSRMFLELVVGSNLEVESNRRASFADAEILHLMRQACAGVDAIHRQGIVHRDLKPANLLLTFEPEADIGGTSPPGLMRATLKIGDFGCAKIVVPESTQTMSRVIGTPRYWSPEQAEGKAATAQADIYALGRIACELLTWDSGRCHLSSAPDRSGAVNAVLRRAMAAVPADRFASAVQFYQAFEETMPQEQAAAAPADGTATTANMMDIEAAWVKDVHRVAASLFFERFLEYAATVRHILLADGKAIGVTPDMRETGAVPYPFGELRGVRLRSGWRHTVRAELLAVVLGPGGLGPDGAPAASLLDSLKELAASPDVFYEIGVFSPSGWPEEWTRVHHYSYNMVLYLVEVDANGRWTAHGPDRARAAFEVLRHDEQVGFCQTDLESDRDLNSLAAAPVRIAVLAERYRWREEVVRDACARSERYGVRLIDGKEYVRRTR